MFLIMGISQKEKRLNFDQLIICKCCGKYGHIEVLLTYSYFMLFFIPIFKWNKQYYVRMKCCGSSCLIDPQLGKAIERGEVTSLNPEELTFGYGGSNPIQRQCTNCGFTTMEDYQFCPKCGNRI